MKKLLLLSISILISLLPNKAFPLVGINNIVTAIEVSDIKDNVVTLKWKSDKQEGAFSIYYNKNNIIRDKFVLKDSELAVRTTLAGKQISDLYEYEYNILLREAGSYYFAVLLDSSTAIDDIARGIVDIAIDNVDYPLISEINTTVQPVAVSLPKKKYDRFKIQDNFLANTEYLITSLNLQSSEDIFRLKWNVYPKDLTKYIFVIYRSRYPITQFGSPQGLPAYARVTNQFFYEDRNINFETPYYYAVVAENSNQWDAGINVFNQPAVLLRESPPFQVKPTIEYIKRKEPLFTYKSEALSEEDIQKAVQETLSNLQILPIYRTNEKTVDQILEQSNAPIVINPLTLEEITNYSLLSNQATTINSLTLEEITNYSLVSNQLSVPQQEAILQKEDSKAVFQNIENEHTNLAKNYIESIIKNRNQSLRDQEHQEQQLIEEDQKDYYSTMDKIGELSSKISFLDNLENKLVSSDNLSYNNFKNQLTIYFNHRDQIRIAQFRLQSDIKALSGKRESREEEFLNNIKEIQNSELLQMNQLKVQYTNNYLEMREKSILEQQKLLAAEQKLRDVIYKEAREAEQKIREEKYRKYIVKDLADKFHSLDVNNIEKPKDLGIIYDDEVSKINENNYNYNDDLYDNDKPNDKKYVVPPYEPQSMPEPKLPKQKSPENRLKDVKNNYIDVIVEKIPTINEHSSENWIVKKEIWLQNNKEIWNAKNRLWNDRTREILGSSDYDKIRSKWLNPSQIVALREGKKSVNRENYEEAIYLLTFVAKDPTALMLLGKSYYELGAYRDAFSVFVTALQMEIPEAKYWLEVSSEKILEKNIQENRN